MSIEQILAEALETKYAIDRTILDGVDLHDDSILVVDRKTGCHFVGNRLIHTESCMCGDYPE